MLAAASAWADDDPRRRDAVLDPVAVTGSRPVDGDRRTLGSALAPDDAPIDVRTVPSAVLLAPGNTSISSVLSRDASVQDNYATSGYYQNFMVRGFTLDLGSGYRINGFVVPGEFDIPLDNMAAVRILEGVAGGEGGTVAAGGTIDFLTRRPGTPGLLRADLGPRGERLVSLSGDAVVAAAGDVAVRLQASHADLRPEQPRAEGRRDLLSLAVDAHVGPGLLLQADLIAQRRSQPAVPGFQLLGGTTLPDLSVRELNINRQPWSRPVANRGAMVSMHLGWQPRDGVRIDAGIAETVVRTDDNLATPTGCNTAPVQYFCGNGDYVLYDYHASERRSGGHAFAAVHAVLGDGLLAHAVSAGIERIERTIRQLDLYSATVSGDAGNALTGNLGSTADPLPRPEGIGVDLPQHRATQTAAFVSDRMAAGPVELLASLRLVEISQRPDGDRRRRALPQLALAWRLRPGLEAYVAAAKGLQFGSEAPLVAANAGVLLAPRPTRQIELGWKAGNAAGAQLAMAAFSMRRRYEFTAPEGASYAGLGDFMQAGTQTHIGISLHGHSAPADALRLEGSVAILRARATGTGVAGIDGAQVQNVPRLAGFLEATYALPWLPIDVLLASTQRGRRSARRDGSVAVSGYAVFDAGVDWRGRVLGRSAVLALRVRNLADRRYWRDAGEAYSADLLFPGASRTLAASAQLAF